MNHIKWTEESLRVEALKYTNRTKFQQTKQKAYQKAKLLGILDTICSHMTGNKSLDSWKIEDVKTEALKYTNRTDFQQESSSAYRYAHKNKIIDEICSHMVNQQKPNGYWTKENCHIEALKYTTRSLFKKESTSAYQVALKMGIMDDICLHMSNRASMEHKQVFIYCDNTYFYVGITNDIEKRKRELNKIFGDNYTFSIISDMVDVKKSKTIKEKFIKESLEKGLIIFDVVSYLKKEKNGNTTKRTYNKKTKQKKDLFYNSGNYIVIDEK